MTWLEIQYLKLRVLAYANANPSDETDWWAHYIKLCKIQDNLPTKQENCLK